MTVGEDPISLVIASSGDARASGGVEPAQRRGRDKNDSTIEIALVNNMPDSAFDETERQFTGLLESAAHATGDLTVRVSRYWIPGLARSTPIQERLARDYQPVDHLYGRRPDGLIVTGTEPLTSDLKAEPYWGALS